MTNEIIDIAKKFNPELVCKLIGIELYVKTIC